jgi:hypothetical protein
MVAAIVAGGATLLSLVLGLLRHVPFLVALVRALLFGGIFFGIIAAIYFLFNKFLATPGNPEKVTPDGEAAASGADDQLGQNFDYSVGDGDEGDIEVQPLEDGEGEGVLPLDPDDQGEEEGGPAETEESFEGLEQNVDSGYTGDEGSLLPHESTGDEAGIDMNMGAFIPGMPGVSDDDDGPSGSESVFSPRASRGGAGTVDMSVEKKADRAAKFGKDFDGKKMAGAIQTLLKKDED